MTFDVEGARKAGYSDSEIADHLAKESGFDYSGAKKAGYGDSEIISHLRQAVTKFDKPAAPEKGFGQRLGEELSDVPRQLGLTVRHGLEGGLGFLGIATDPLAKLMGVPTAEQTGRNIADKFGLPTPQTKIEKIVAEPTKLIASMAMPLGVAQRGSKLLTGMTDDVLREMALNKEGLSAMKPSTVGAEVARSFASNPMQQLQAATGAGLAGGYTKETGGDALSQGVASLAGGLAAPASVGLVKGIPQAAKSTVEFLAPGLTKNQIPAQVDLVITNLLKYNGLTMKDVSASFLNQMRQDVSTALKTGGKLDDAALRRLSDYRMIGATPTRAKITLDPVELTRQKKVASFGANSADTKLQELAQIENRNNNTLIESLNGLGANTADDAYAGAQTVMGNLRNLDEANRSVIDNLYAQARASSGRSAAIDPSAFTRRANNLLDDALLGGKLPSDVRNLLNKTATGDMPLTVDVAEQFKTRIGDLQRTTTDMAERKALGLVRQALDDAPLLEGQGQGAIDAFNKARTANRQWMGIVEKVPALQAVRDGIEPDKFVNQFIIGNGSKSSVMDVAKVKTLVKDSPEAMQAIRGQMMSYIKSKALGGASDEVGKISQSNLMKAIESIGERKLRLFFSKDEIAQLKAISRVASYEQVQPVGSYVNNSNTAAATLSTLFDKMASSPLMSKIPMLPQFAGNVSASLTARNALNAPKAVVEPAKQGGLIAPYMLPMMAGTGLLAP